ncbi:MAG: hypothetical protein ACYTDV_14925 [Planctomycetota bacterium]|jgi:hypothetical protein
MGELSGKRIPDKSPHANDSATGKTLSDEAGSDQQPAPNSTAAIAGAAASAKVAAFTKSVVVPAADSEPNTAGGTAADRSKHTASSMESSEEAGSAAAHDGETAISSDGDSTSTSAETPGSFGDEETTDTNMQPDSRPDSLVEEANKSLRGVLSQAIEQITANPAASLQAQANVVPDTALHLLVERDRCSAPD